MDTSTLFLALPGEEAWNPSSTFQDRNPKNDQEPESMQATLPSAETVEPKRELQEELTQLPLNIPPSSDTSSQPSPTSSDLEFCILCTVSRGFFDFFINWFTHLTEIGGIHNVTNIYILAEDDEVKDLLERQPIFGSNIVIESGSIAHDKSDSKYLREHQYGSQGYYSMVSTRATHILRHLRQGRNVLYSDMDVVWKRDPFPFFQGDDVDLWVQVDVQKYNEPPHYCTGFMAIRANQKTIQFMEVWERELQKKPQLNQPVFNEIIHNASVVGDLNHRQLPAEYFPSGKQFFDMYDDVQREQVVTVHNNFVVGHDRKMGRFVQHGLWKVSAIARAMQVPSKGKASDISTSGPEVAIQSTKRDFCVLVTVSSGFLDFFFNWWVHLEAIGSLHKKKTIYIVAEDDDVQKALEGVQFEANVVIEKGALTEKTNKSSAFERRYDSPEYRSMVSTRPIHILRHLNKGENVLYSDMDTVWKRDPFPYFESSSNDLMLQVDRWKAGKQSPHYCTGFMAIQSNNATIQFMEEWNRELQREAQLNQPVFNKLIHEVFPRHLELYNTTFHHQALPSAFFASGQQYFKEFNETQREQTIIVHNNYIVGHDKKKNRFQKNGLWQDAAIDKLMEQAALSFNEGMLGNGTSSEKPMVNSTSSFCIMVTVSKGFLDFFENFWGYLELIGDLHETRTIYIVTEDDEIHKTLEDRFATTPNVVLERSELSLAKAVKYRDKKYYAMVSSRATHLLRHLRQGHNVLYSDVDIIWQKDPFPYFENEEEVDAYLQIDGQQTFGYKPFYCTGFMALRSNERVIRLMEIWEARLRIKNQLNQPVFNEIIHGTANETQLRENSDLFASLVHRGFDRILFANGDWYRNRLSEKQRSEAVIMHNNFVIGRDRKLDRFLDYGLWLRGKKD